MNTFLGVINFRGYLDKHLITDDLPLTLSTTTTHISFSLSPSPLFIFACAELANIFTAENTKQNEEIEKLPSDKQI